jgi:hypothetical protein
LVSDILKEPKTQSKFTGIIRTGAEQADTKGETKELHCAK